MRSGAIPRGVAFCRVDTAAPTLLLKKIGERLASICRLSGGRFAFDNGPGAEQLARIAAALVDDACADWFSALEPRARIERNAHPAGVEVGVAFRTRTLEIDVGLNCRAARRALHFLAKGHHSRRARTFAFAGFRRRFWALFALSIFVHVTALAVFAVAHFLSPFEWIS